MQIYSGFSQAKITPKPNSVFLDGYGFRLEPAQGVRDDLYVKVCAFKDSENNKFCIVSMDVCGFNKEVSEIIKFHIKMKSYIEKDNVALCATHTHAGPACGVLHDLPLNNDYWNHVGEITANCVNEAFENIQLSYFTTQFGKDIVSAHNRRGRGFIDKSVRVGSFFNSDKLIGLFARTSCHAVNQTSMDISADFPSVLTKTSNEYEVPFIFLQGSCGDINPLFDSNVTIDDRIETLGSELSSSVLGCLQPHYTEDNLNTSKIVSRYDEIKVPMQNYPSKEELTTLIKKTAEEYYAANQEVNKHISLRLLNYYKSLLDKVNNNEAAELKVPVQVLYLTDDKDKAMFIFLPFEMFTNTVLNIEENINRLGVKKESIFVVGYSNEVFGYLIPKEEIGIGGYEVLSAPTWYNTPFFCEESEKSVIKCINKLVNEVI